MDEVAVSQCRAVNDFDKFSPVSRDSNNPDRPENRRKYADIQSFPMNDRMLCFDFYWGNPRGRDDSFLPNLGGMAT